MDSNNLGKKVLYKRKDIIFCSFEGHGMSDLSID